MTKLAHARSTIFAGLFGLFAAGSLAACEKPTSEYIDALPNRQVATIQLPEEGQTTQGLIGQTRSGLVGAPADMYTNTYYQARNLNGLAVFVVNLLETITAYPATTVTDHSAVWGPFGDAQEPNQWVLAVERKTEAAETHYEWYIAGKHRSAPDSAYVAIAAGAFAPSTTPDQGRGWFAIDFDLIRTLNPTESGKGRIAYAYDKNDLGVHVLAFFEGPDAMNAVTTAAYAYGESTLGEHYVVFAFQGDIDDGRDGRTQKEDVLIRSRWNEGPGRADVLAVHGDLGNDVAQASQCWDGSFVSTFEVMTVNGQVLATGGDAATCAFSSAEVPDEGQLPSAEEVESPFPAPSANE